MWKNINAVYPNGQFVVNYVAILPEKEVIKRQMLGIAKKEGYIYPNGENAENRFKYGSLMLRKRSNQ